MSERLNTQGSWGQSKNMRIPIQENVMPNILTQASTVARLAVQKTSLEEFSHTLGCGCFGCQRQSKNTGEWVKDMLSTNSSVETIIADARYGLLAISLLGGKKIL